MSAPVRKFNGVAEQIKDNLVKSYFIYKQSEAFFRMPHGERDIFSLA